jgi:hypothetical protein
MIKTVIKHSYQVVAGSQTANITAILLRLLIAIDLNLKFTNLPVQDKTIVKLAHFINFIFFYTNFCRHLPTIKFISVLVKRVV